MNVIITALSMVGVLIVCQHEALAFDIRTIQSSSVKDRLQAFKQANASRKGKPEESCAGADPDGIFENCECTTDVHRNCVCKGCIATGVTASMHMRYLAVHHTVNVEVKCNEETVLALGDLQPDAASNVCAVESECGGADVKICFRLYHMTSSDEPGFVPQGCNDVTVIINGGQEKIYTECMPRTQLS